MMERGQGRAKGPRVILTQRDCRASDSVATHIFVTTGGQDRSLSQSCYLSCAAMKLSLKFILLTRCHILKQAESYIEPTAPLMKREEKVTCD